MPLVIALVLKPPSEGFEKNLEHKTVWIHLEQLIYADHVDVFIFI